MTTSPSSVQRQRDGEVRLAGAGGSDDGDHRRRPRCPARGAAGRARRAQRGADRQVGMPSDTPVCRRRRAAGRGHAAGVGLRPVPGVAGAGAAQAVVRRRCRVGDQVEGGGLGDGHRDQVAGRGALGAVGDARSAPAAGPGPGRRAGGFPRPCGPDWAVTMTSTPAAQLLGVFLGGDPVLQGGQALEAFLHHGLGQLVRQVRGGGAGPLGVLEGEGGGEAGLLHDVERGLEVLLGLAGESDDDVGGDGRVRHLLADLVQDAQELGGPVGPAHVLEDLVRAGLQRHVQLRHDVGGLGHGVDDVVGEGGRVRAGEPDAFQALDVAAGAQQLAEGLPVAELHAVGVHVLAQQRDLDGAVVDERLDLGQDLARAGGPSPCRAGPGRCRRCRCCCSRPRWRPSRSRRSRAWWAAWRGRRPAIRGSPAAPRRCGGHAPAAPAAPRRCGCRRRRPPRAPSSGWSRGPSAPGSRPRRSACPGWLP